MAVRIARCLGGALPAVVACAFASPGDGQAGGHLGDADGGSGTAVGEGDSGEATGTSAGEKGDQGGQGDQGGTGVGADDTAGTGDTDPKGMLPDAGGAHVVFVDASPLDLGDIELATGIALPPLDLRNDGDATASAFSAGAPMAPLSWAGGAFPGTGGTCTGDLAPGQVCSVVLAPLPAPIGLSSQTLGVAYDDAGVPEKATLEVNLGGVGQTEILMNGGFEDGASGAAPPGWMIGGGSWTAQSGEGYMTDKAAYGGPTGYDTTVTLLQDLDLSPWSATIVATGLHFAISGVAHTQSNDSDQWNAAFAQYDISDTAVWSTQTGFRDDNGWTAFSDGGTLHSAARRIRATLQCHKYSGTDCSARFDALSIVLSYPP